MDQSNVDLRQELDQLASNFEEAHRSTNQSIEQFLLSKQISLPRWVVLQELVLVEIELRLKRNENLDVEEYVQRFEELDPNWLRGIDIQSFAADKATASAENSTRSFLVIDEPTVVYQTNAIDTPSVLNIGDYEILSEIARGGMGVVFKARQKSLNRLVALKMILSGQFAGTEEIKRFKSEAESAAKLDHPGIVPIYEIGEHEGNAFFSMGFIDGESLAERLKHSPMPPTQAADIVRKVASAIAYSHEHGVIHRDLKPANIIIDSNGEPKVTDFGLAKRLDDNELLTGTGQILGTPGFMPPEQAAGEVGSISESADVYGLGAILYCLLTGRPPFQSANHRDTLIQVMQQEPVGPRSFNPKIPLDLETICLKCLEKERSKRYATASQVLDELERFVTRRPILARPTSRLGKAVRWCRRRPALATSLAISIALLLTLSIAGPIVAYNQIVLSQTVQQALDKSESSLKREIDANARLANSIRNEKQQLSDSLIQRGLEYAKNGEPVALHMFLRAFQSAPQGHPLRTTALNLMSGWKNSISELIPSASAGNDGIGVNKCIFHPDGKHILLGGLGELQLWSIDPISLVNVLHKRQSVETVAKLRGSDWTGNFSDDGNYLVSFCNKGASISHLGYDKNIYLRQAFDGKILRKFQVTEVPTQVEFAANRLLVAVSKNLQVWDIRQTKKLFEIEHSCEIDSFFYSPETDAILLTGKAGTRNDVRVWNLINGEPIGDHFQVDGHIVAIRADDGEMRIAVSTNNGVHLWNPKENNKIDLSLERGVNASKGSYSGDGSTLLLQCDDNIVRLFKGLSGELINKIPQSRILAFALSEDGKRIYTRDHDSISAWDRDTGSQLTKPIRVSNFPASFTSSPKGDVLVTGFVGLNSARVWRPGTNLTKTRFACRGTMYHARFSPDGSTFATISKEDERFYCQLWDSSSGKKLSETVSISQNPIDLYCGNSQVLAAIIDENKLLTIDAMTGQVVNQVIEQQEVLTAAFVNDGKTILTGQTNGDIKSWDVSTGQLLCANTLDDRVTSICAGKSGKLVVFATGDRGSIWSLDPKTLEPVRKNFTTGKRMLELALSDDEKVLLAAPGFSLQQGGKIQAWELSTALRIGKPFEHSGFVPSVAISPNGQICVTNGTTNKQLKFWDTNSGYLRGSPITFEESMGYVAEFSPNGRSLLVGGTGGQIVRIEPPLLDQPTYLNNWVECRIGTRWDPIEKSEKPLTLKQWIERLEKLHSLTDNGTAKLATAPQPIIRSGPTKFTHHASGIAFRFPEDWVSSGTKTILFTTSLGLNTKDGSAKVTIFWKETEMANPEKLAEREFEALTPMYGSMLGRPTPIKVDGVTGYKMTIESTKSKGSGLVYIFGLQRKNKNWRIKIRATYQDSAEVVEKLLSCFEWN